MMRMITVTLMVLLLAVSLSSAETTVKVKQATISGVTVKLGQGADIVQSRITAVKYEPASSYGGTSKGYYSSGKDNYIISYAPGKGAETYIVTKIELVKKSESKEVKGKAIRKEIRTSSSKLTHDAVIAARRKYKVQVLRFDASKEIGSEFPYSDYVRLSITNNSNVVLPTLTVLTKRFDSSGKIIGSSRAPELSVSNLKPGESTEIDYYPRGHLPDVRNIAIEIERNISKKNAQFFKELPQ